MNTWSTLTPELEDAKALIGKGQAKKALERLRLLLEQLHPQNPNYSYESGRVLLTLSLAAAETGEATLADEYIRKAALYLKHIPAVRASERAELMIETAEALLVISNTADAVQFSEAALLALADSPDEFAHDEAAEVLRRYANIATAAGCLSAAYLALTVGLLLIQDEHGLESSIAVDITALTNLACKSASSLAIGRVGQILLAKAA
jgi:hypothetical protein